MGGRHFSSSECNGSTCVCRTHEEDATVCFRFKTKFEEKGLELELNFSFRKGSTRQFWVEET